MISEIVWKWIYESCWGSQQKKEENVESEKVGNHGCTIKKRKCCRVWSIGNDHYLLVISMFLKCNVESVFINQFCLQQTTQYGQAGQPGLRSGGNQMVPEKLSANFLSGVVFSATN